MSVDHERELTDRQARAVIAAAEQKGFEREPDRIFWSYDKTLHCDARAALRFLERDHRELIPEALEAADPIPAWAAVERIANDGRGLSSTSIQALIDAAVKRGLMVFELPGPDPVGSLRWHEALRAIGMLWDHDPEALGAILGDQARIAMLPETAIARCPSCCDGGWVPHRFAGELPPEPPRLGMPWR